MTDDGANTLMDKITMELWNRSNEVARHNDRSPATNQRELFSISVTPETMLCMMAARDRVHRLLFNRSDRSVVTLLGFPVKEVGGLGESFSINIRPLTPEIKLCRMLGMEIS